MNFKNMKRSRKIGIALVLAATVFLAVGTVLGNFVNILTTNFELGPGAASDENGLTNILGNTTDPGPDWADLFDGSGNFIGSTGTGAFLADDISAGGLVDNTVYSGGPGDKNSDIIADWAWANRRV